MVYIGKWANKTLIPLQLQLLGQHLVKTSQGHVPSPTSIACLSIAAPRRYEKRPPERFLTRYLLTGFNGAKTITVSNWDALNHHTPLVCLFPSFFFWPHIAPFDERHFPRGFKAREVQLSPSVKAYSENIGLCVVFYLQYWRWTTLLERNGERYNCLCFPHNVL